MAVRPGIEAGARCLRVTAGDSRSRKLRKPKRGRKSRKAASMSEAPECSRLAASVVAFLRSPAAARGLSADAAEGLVVAAQCLETSFGLNERPPAGPPPDLLAIFRRYAEAEAAPAGGRAFVAAAGPFLFGEAPAAPAPPRVDPESKARADALKNEGNALMKAEKFQEALDKYTEAIGEDAGNAIYFCNRAAAHSSLKNDERAIEDCKKALALNPQYGRAYGRLGLALTNLERHAEARDAYRIACRLEPNNEAYRNNLAVTEETLARRPPPPQQPFAGLDLGALMQNRALANVATQMLSDPGLQSFMGRLIGDLGAAPPEPENGGAGAGAGAGGLDALLQAGQQLAQQMQQANPDLIERLRRQMTEPGAPPQPPQDPPGKPPQ